MKIIKLLTISIVLGCSNGQTTDGPKQAYNLSEQIAGTSDRVKRKITGNYDYKPGDKCVGGFTTYNENGQMLEELDYSSCEKLFKRVQYNYDTSGRIISSNFLSDFEQVTYNYVYNDRNKLIEQVAMKPTHSFAYRLTYSYDSLGKQIEYIGTMVDGSAFSGTSRKEFIYDKGKKVKTICYGGPNFNLLGYRIEHIYDNEGREIKNYVFKDPNSEKVDTTFFYYEYF